MKLLFALILSTFMIQALALPAFEDPNAPEHMPEGSSGVEHMPVSERVDAFRADIESWFVRFQNFYDRSNAQMRNYRFAHVDLVTRVYNNLMTVFGDHLESLRQANLMDLLASRRTELGNENECIDGVSTKFNSISTQNDLLIQGCAVYANISFAGMLQNVFYPVFANIQSTISTVPLAVIDALSRGNVLQDEEAIIAYLAARFEVIEMQWLTAVSQLLRWESNRFEVDGLFMVDQVGQCLSSATFNFMTASAGLASEAHAC